MAIFREKIFGPVLSVMTFNTVEKVVQLANDAHYGLGTGIWSKGIDNALLVSKRLRSGTVCVYTFLETAVQLPFGGLGQSGLGRENGLEGLLEFHGREINFHHARQMLRRIASCAGSSAVMPLPRASVKGLLT